MESESSICNIANDINNEVKEILTKYLSPHLAQMNQDRMNMKCIENILRGMPEFQRLEKENIELRRQLEAKESKHVSSAPAYEPAALVPEPAALVPEPAALEPEPAALVPEPAALEPATRCIKLDIIESPIVEDNVTNELELYKVADLLHIANNEASDEVEASANEVETEEEDEEASEAEEETEAEEEADEETEAEEETEASEAEQTEAEASEAEEEEEQEEEEAEEEQEAEEEEEEEQEAEQEEASEAEEEQEEEEEEEVSLIVINGISYYTTNETSGDIYKVEGTDDVGDQVGKFVNKVATFF